MKPHYRLLQKLESSYSKNSIASSTFFLSGLVHLKRYDIGIVLCLVNGTQHHIIAPEAAFI